LFHYTLASWCSAMGQEDDILTLIDLIYETAFDSTLWPVALTGLPTRTGTAQVAWLPWTVAPISMIRSPRVPIQSWTRDTRTIGHFMIRFGLS